MSDVIIYAIDRLTVTISIIELTMLSILLYKEVKRKR